MEFKTKANLYFCFRFAHREFVSMYRIGFGRIGKMAKCAWFRRDCVAFWRLRPKSEPPGKIVSSVTSSKVWAHTTDTRSDTFSVRCSTVSMSSSTYGWWTNSWAAHSWRTERTYWNSPIWIKRIDPIPWSRCFRAWPNAISTNTERRAAFRSTMPSACWHWTFSMRKSTFSYGFGSSFWPSCPCVRSFIRRWSSCCRAHAKPSLNDDSVRVRKKKSKCSFERFRYVCCCCGVGKWKYDIFELFTQVGDFLLLHLLGQNVNINAYCEVLKAICRRIENTDSGPGTPSAPSTLEMAPIYSFEGSDKEALA